MKDEVLTRIASHLCNLDSEKLREAVREAISSGVSPKDVMTRGLGLGVEEVGAKYESGEYFLSDLIIAGEIFSEAVEMIQPYMGTDSAETKGIVLIGTVQGDLHDIGKNIVAVMLRSAGFRIHDVGVDVSPAVFVRSTKVLEPDIVCLSALLTVVIPKVKETIDVLRGAGLRKSAKILVGGRAMSVEVAGEVGADAWGRDAWDAVRKAKDLMNV